MIEDYIYRDYVIGIILSGSYATGNYTDNSDIDVHIVTSNVNWKERGNKIIDGKMILEDTLENITKEKNLEDKFFDLYLEVVGDK